MKYFHRSRICSLFLLSSLFLCARERVHPKSAAHSPGTAKTQLALTPPMGWNSWDGYGTTINEEEFKANAQWFATHLKPAGWKYVVIDMEWFVTNPTGQGNSKNSHFSLDGIGRYTPALNRFPSAKNDAGFKPLADYAHSLGLKFGIHILRGIPKEAVEKNLPIADASVRASDAADNSDTCPWNQDNFGVDPRKPAAQAYYDSIARLYAGWGVDLIKVDCIASHPFKGEDIRMLAQALRNTGRLIVLSLSPGPAPLEKVDELRKYAQMWRISDDVWDIWHSNVPYPQGLGDQFANIARWAGKAQPGHWPDADMLPLGYLGPAPGWGEARNTRLSHDEQVALMTLWCMFPSPLMVGGRLPSADDWTISLLTNAEVLAVDQHSTENQPIVTSDKVVIWRAKSRNGYYFAGFNISDSIQTLRYDWADLGLKTGRYKIRDLWMHKDLGTAGSLTVELRPHASVLYSATRTVK